MKNPFHNTQHYAIVRQFNKLTQRKRSFSNSFQSDSPTSLRSSQARQDVQHHAPYQKIKFQRQYIGVTGKSNVYDVERKRAQLFGVEQLRYKPLYFESLPKNKEKIQIKQSGQNMYRCPALKTQKSLKQISPKRSQKKLTIDEKYTDNIKNKDNEKDQILSIKKIKQKKQQQSQKQLLKQRQQQLQQQQEYEEGEGEGEEEGVGEISDKVNQEQSRKSIRTYQRRGSVLQQMIQISTNAQSQRLNQFYGSTIDLKSKMELFRSNDCIPQGKIRKKNSIFYQHQVNNLNLKESRVSSYASEKRQSIKGEVFKDSDSEEDRAKDKIVVRNKVYYRYSPNQF